MSGSQNPFLKRSRYDIQQQEQQRHIGSVFSNIIISWDYDDFVDLANSLLSVV